MVMLAGSEGAPSGATQVLAALLRARTGQELAANRQWRIEVAVRPLLHTYGLDTIEQLVTRLLGRNDPALGDQIVDALLNQETSFYRDTSVFTAAAEALAVARGPLRQRIWCAGCSTGQEPLSLAMQFADAVEPAPEIIASDVSASAIARARAGRYNQFEIQRGLPIRTMMRWFDNRAGDEWVANADLLRRVSYRQHNLITDRPPPGGFDAVFCRNVLFYFAPSVRAGVLDRLADALRPGGLLVLGAGETVIGMSNRFVPSRRFRGFYEALPGVHEARRAG